ncbi:APC family permease [Brevibacillus fluminis]|uniref:APC family permease n=1 Tax=Brevibacillus fluminis TaxID=511487 RepID=UPI003F8C0D66
MQHSHTTYEQAGSLKKTLKLWHVVVLGLGYLTPMTVFDTFGIVSQDTHGHVPTAYLIALIAMLFTAASYGKMVKEFPTAGSAYSYTSKAINPHLGFMVGWVSLLDYFFLPMINVLLAKIYLSAAFPGVPEWIWVVSVTLLFTLVNIRSVNLTANFNTLLVIFQILVTGFFVVLAIKALLSGKGAGTVATAEPFFSAGMTMPDLMAGAAVLCFSFLGFDAVTTYTEEAVNPTKTIPRGIVLVALIGGLIFTTASYFATAVIPDVSILQNPDSPSPEIAYLLGGAFFQSLFLAGAITGTIASGLASHTSASRLLFAMGREKVLPGSFLAYVHPRYSTPINSIIVTGVFCLAAIWFDLDTALSFINFGALTAFTAVNISVVIYFVVRKKQHSLGSLIQYVLFPALGAGFVGYLWVSLDAQSITLGLIWAALGLGYLLYTTKGFTKKPPKMDFEEAI